MRLVRRGLTAAPANLVRRSLRGRILEQSLVDVGASSGEAPRQVPLRALWARATEKTLAQRVQIRSSVSSCDARVACDS
jgi:hypothetical protein